MGPVGACPALKPPASDSHPAKTDMAVPSKDTLAEPVGHSKLQLGTRPHASHPPAAVPTGQRGRASPCCQRAVAPYKNQPTEQYCNTARQAESGTM